MVFFFRLRNPQGKEDGVALPGNRPVRGKPPGRHDHQEDKKKAFLRDSVADFHGNHQGIISHRPRITGDRMIRKTAGKMKQTSGNSIFTAACCAIVSARWS